MGSFWLREESGREGENSAETKVGATMPDRNYRDVKKLVFGAGKRIARDSNHPAK
jgi:hypothetical protein